MSEVKKISPVGNIYGWEESQFGEFVLSQDYDDLAAEAQALREEVAAAQKNLAFTEQWYAVRHERLWHWAHEELSEEQKRRYFNIVANGTAEHNEPPIYAQQLCRMKHRAESAEQELAALRARVAVVPDASTVYAALDARERLFTSPENIQVALEAQSRLNGLTVSEGLLRQLLDSDGIDGIFDAQQNYAAHQELRALLNQDKENGNG
ncbi:hypothetical protein Q041_02502 [Pseudomonas aeruginosa BWHPSA028]|uniref:hypothetical protein n=1 Tax=Pseudomonas aeruginosa TaxID=287 RepID=UPI0003B9F09C|nr:hypothetical protein [Pseudomonas aeruginosa]ERV86745.1 hypothetical protein Q041_02502 [Pseudomonas aeruginosa BWHPSA028]HEJ3297309.1 hypothetical protein [Pseudomonas aeruginosa]HEK3404420.1 hypothetical protein [Pseudomonas aeruginosa]